MQQGSCILELPKIVRALYRFVDTVGLNGEGFEQLVEAGTKVKAGTPIIKIDREFILGKGLSLATPVLITNVDAAKSINAVESGSVTAGKDVVLNFEI